MSKLESITIREVEASDLDTFYAHQLDPEAIRMAAFVVDRKDKVVFAAHWDKILKSSQNTNRTIVIGGQVAGHIACYPQGEHLEVTYWLGREFWGRGLATQALKKMLHLVADRPIFARAATDNIGSIRVLQKCGFKIIGKDKGFANGRGEDTEEYILRLDLDQANEQAIHEVHSTWIDAVNAGDLVRLLTLMAEDVVFLNPGQAPFGRNGFSSAFSAAHQKFRISCISELEEVVVVGEVAYTRSRDALSVTPRSGGEATRLAGHRITVYRKQPDGRWLLARDAHTLSPVEK